MWNRLRVRELAFVILRSRRIPLRGYHYMLGEEFLIDTVRIPFRAGRRDFACMESENGGRWFCVRSFS